MILPANREQNMKLCSLQLEAFVDTDDDVEVPAAVQRTSVAVPLDRRQRLGRPSGLTQQ